MHVQVLIATQTEARNIYPGAEHIPLQEQTLICGYLYIYYNNFISLI